MGGWKRGLGALTLILRLITLVHVKTPPVSLYSWSLQNHYSLHKYWLLFPSLSGYHDHMMILTTMIIRKMSEIPCFGRKNGVVDDHHNDDTMTMVMTMIMEMLWWERWHVYCGSKGTREASDRSDLTPCLHAGDDDGDDDYSDGDGDDYYNDDDWWWWWCWRWWIWW